MLRNLGRVLHVIEYVHCVNKLRANCLGYSRNLGRVVHCLHPLPTSQQQFLSCPQLFVALGAGACDSCGSCHHASLSSMSPLQWSDKFPVSHLGFRGPPLRCSPSVQKKKKLHPVPK